MRLRVAGAFQELGREGRHIYWIDAAGRRHTEVDWTSDRNRPLIAAVRQAQEAAASAFLDMLRRGHLVAWGRAGGPLAPLRRVPADAWAVLRLTHVGDGRAEGPGVALFGLRVAPAEPAPEAAAEPAGGGAARPRARAGGGAVAGASARSRRGRRCVDAMVCDGTRAREARDGCQGLRRYARGDVSRRTRRLGRAAVRPAPPEGPPHAAQVGRHAPRDATGRRGDLLADLRGFAAVSRREIKLGISWAF